MKCHALEYGKNPAADAFSMRHTFSGFPDVCDSADNP